MDGSFSPGVTWAEHRVENGWSSRPPIASMLSHAVPSEQLGDQLGGAGRAVGLNVAVAHRLAVTALKNDPDIGRIALSGSVSVVRQLLDTGLVDDLHLFVHPAAAGTGLRLFEEDGRTR